VYGAGGPEKARMDCHRRRANQPAEKESRLIAGESGQLLDNMLKCDFDLTREQDVYVTSAGEVPSG
jgi:hypothetical protein